MEDDTEPRELTRNEIEIEAMRDGFTALLKEIVKPPARTITGYCIFCAATLFDDLPYCGGHTDEDDV